MRRAFMSLGVLYLVGTLGMAPAWAQDDVISAEETMIVFIIFIVAVISLFLYLARHSIMRRRTRYDRRDFDSKKNRDYEKYHSSWHDDYVDYHTRDGKHDVPNYYDILGVSPDATAQDIKIKYRRLAKEIHPDVSGDDSDTDMARINEAYEVLSDKERRAEYDKTI